MKIWFRDFWGTFDKYDNLFIYVLKQNYNIEITPDNPDIVFTDSRNYQKSGNEIAIYFSGEPFFNINQCDYAMTSFYVDDNRFIRLPLYLLYAYDLYKIGYTKSFNAIKTKANLFQARDKFCAYISQGAGGEKSPRTSLVQLINQYKIVDCAGNHLNNCAIVPGEPGAIDGSKNKIDFLKNYKFAFAIENNDSFNDCIGYTTEKIFEPMLAGCIPIYWGNERINEDFNENSFINAKNYTESELLNKIIEIDSNDDLYLEYLSEPFITSSQLFNIDYLISLFSKIMAKF
jgi:hypothetical protein